ncbi:SPFH domain-containing protein [Euzebya rosea]|uniref:SPFH domain-containing protein n=1 Tax=Euzebya rosea TaxID=2052804 RepID=UPI001300A800|nr:SPFH domain-containing protein [Euzebya rosea]
MSAVVSRPGRSVAGIGPLLFAIVGGLLAVGLVIAGGVRAADGRAGGGALVVLGVLLVVAAILVAAGLYTLQPNQGAVLTLFGDYRGTDVTAGLRFANPLYRKRIVSLRVRNFTTESSKVNDANGNPIMIAAVVVWKVVDTAKAVFGVDDFIDYVHIQSESAVRQLARSYPYDSFDDVAVTTLIGDTGEVNDDLLAELQERADEAGVLVTEARITDLSYAPEIAEAMLRRQQASAIVAARAKIVEGAVLMVRDAIEQLEAGTTDGDAIPLDNDRKATFASNLMTVIASDNPTSPVVNVGTLSR